MSLIDLPNIGIVIEKLNPFVFKLLKKEVDVFLDDFKKSSNHDLNHDLLRQFHKRKTGYTTEYQLSSKLANLIKVEVLKLIEQIELRYGYFDKIFNFTANVESCELELNLERIWVNLQGPGEFLPLHNHTGIYSFVIWVTAPFDMQNEKDTIINQDLIKSRQGNFEFVYTDSLGKITTHTIPVDYRFEGMICVFPSELYHQVYPYYSSSDIRSSVAGNFRLEILKK